jgi:hypothetical protein
VKKDEFRQAKWIESKLSSAAVSLPLPLAVSYFTRRGSNIYVDTVKAGGVFDQKVLCLWCEPMAGSAPVARQTELGLDASWLAHI